MAIRSPIIVTVGHVDHGKCVAPETLIPLADGRMLTAKEIFENYSRSGETKDIEDGYVVESGDAPEIFSLDNGKVVTKRITHLWKLHSKDLLRIKLKSGDEISTTQEHPYLVMDNLGSMHWKKAAEVELGDYVAVPRRLPFGSELSAVKKQIFERLCKIEDFLVFLKDESEFIKEIKEKKPYILRNSGFFTTDPASCIENKRFRSCDFAKLAKMLGYRWEEAYALIGWIKNSSTKQRAGHRSNKMLLPHTPEQVEAMGYVLGALAGDGYIPEGKLCNNDKCVQDAYMNAVKKAFGLDCKVIQGHTCQEVLTSGGKTFERFMFEVIGFPSENKSRDVAVPELVAIYRPMAKAFIRGYFDTDGYASIINNIAEITSKSGKIIRQVSVMLLGMGIHSVVYKKGGYYNLRIGNNPFLGRFLDGINPSCEPKSSRISSVLGKVGTSRVFDLIPISGACLEGVRLKDADVAIPYFSRYKSYERLSRSFCKKLQSVSQISVGNSVSQVINGDVSLVEVIRKERCDNPEGFVYDFTIPDTHCFVAERVFVHNTTLLDKIRGTAVAEGEPGAITQYISASYVPTSVINKKCGALLDKMKVQLKIPGLLFIDTPGHEAFTTLRKRGGAIADLAILVVDANEGFKPQTLESLNYLKQFRTPFVVAMTKIDRLPGWNPVKDACFCESMKSQGERANEEIEKRVYNIVGQLGMHGFNAERYDRLEDYTKQVAVVPISGVSGEGVADLLMTLAGIAQKYLSKNLEITPGEGKGTVLEVKEHKGLGTTLDVILYDGEIRRGDSLVIGGLGDRKTIKTKVKTMLEPSPLKELRLEKEFKSVDCVSAAAGIKIAAQDLEGVTAGAPLRSVSDERKIPELEKEIKAEMDEVEIETESEGIFIRSDTLGGLEAVVKTLKERDIPVMKAHVGAVTKSDVLLMKIYNDPIMMVFGVKVSEEIEQLAKDNRIALFHSNIIYTLLENYDKWVKDRKKREEQALLDEAIRPGMIRVLKGYVFRQSKPAVFGVEVLKGTIKPGYRLTLNDKVVGKIKEIQSEGISRQEAKAGERVAISMEDVVIGKDFVENDVLKTHFTTESNKDRILKVRHLLRDDEREMLAEAEK